MIYHRIITVLTVVAWIPMIWDCRCINYGQIHSHKEHRPRSLWIHTRKILGQPTNLSFSLTGVDEEKPLMSESNFQYHNDL